MKEMTFEEMKRQYDAEWVIIVDPILDQANKVVSGKVLYHSTDRDEVYRKGAEPETRQISKNKCIAFEFFGEPVPGTINVL